MRYSSRITLEMHATCEFRSVFSHGGFPKLLRSPTQEYYLCFYAILQFQTMKKITTVTKLTTVITRAI